MWEDVETDMSEEEEEEYDTDDEQEGTIWASLE